MRIRGETSMATAFDTPFLAASIVLVAMGCLSLIISLSLSLKSRAIGKYPSDPQVEVFKRTFNIFNPYPGQRKVVHENLELLILFAIYGSFVGIGFAILKVFEFGFLLAFITLVICLGFLLIDETLEIYKNVGIFLKAFKKHAFFGKGDLEVLTFLRHTLPRLSHYHLMVAIGFFAASLAVPTTVNVFLWGFSRFAGLMFMTTATLWFFPPFVLLVTGLLFAATVFSVQLVANKIKMRILSFPSPERLNILSEQFYRMKMFVGIQHHHPTLHVPDSEYRKEDEVEVEADES
jgi:hypothetical protein